MSVFVDEPVRLSFRSPSYGALRRAAGGASDVDRDRGGVGRVEGGDIHRRMIDDRRFESRGSASGVLAVRRDARTARTAVPARASGTIRSTGTPSSESQLPADH